MPHPLVDQLRFARSEFLRGLEGLSEEEARRRFLPLNCISWNVGHVAWQEQTRLLFIGQGIKLFPLLDELCARGKPASTPPLDQMVDYFMKITAKVDPWLDGLTKEDLLTEVVIEKTPSGMLWGTVLMRLTYHYWYHLGENAAIRQFLGHTNLPQFVGDIDQQAPYRDL